ncbi:hypothetical protein [Butyrivibrio sp. AC2005]|uniref:hypothetical protein n=1 Tax=Butyrivibrio sp. AC2005 TaxID=1280672 RepID=UPI00047E8C1E|nr:hypothetical protein [Butyrivibrio sp. AC2005]
MGLFDFLKRRNKGQTFQKSDLNIKHPPYYVSEWGEARYFFEHQYLRDQFFSNTKLFTDVIKRRNALYDMSCLVARNENRPNPYRESDFEVDFLRWNSDINLISVGLPTPKYEPLCYRIHMFYSDNYTNLGFYTIESGKYDNGFFMRVEQ